MWEKRAYSDNGIGSGGSGKKWKEQLYKKCCESGSWTKWYSIAHEWCVVLQSQSSNNKSGINILIDIYYI